MNLIRNGLAEVTDEGVNGGRNCENGGDAQQRKAIKAGVRATNGRGFYRMASLQMHVCCQDCPADRSPKNETARLSRERM